ncbi:MAG: Ig domain-containing protein [Bacteroidota bacterium]
MRYFIPIFLLTLISLSAPLSGQEWITRYNSAGIAMDEAASMTTANARIYVTGSSFSPASGWDIVTLCLDRAGNTVWESHQGNPFDEKSVAVAADAAGNVFVLGRVWSSENRWQLVLLGFDSDGTVQMSKTFNSGPSSSDFAIGLGMMNNGNLAVAAESRATDGAVSSVTMGLTRTGTILWTDSYKGAGDAYPRTLSAGAVVGIAGTTHGGPTNDGFIVLYQNDGSRIASRSYDNGSDADETFSASTLDSQGNFHVSGWSAASASSSQVLLANYAADGSYLSDYLYTPGNTGRHRAVAISVDEADDVLLTARIDAGNGDFNILTTKRGSSPWESVYSPTGGQVPDNTAPAFSGATAGFSPATGSITVVWHPASDAQAMPDEVSYEAYLSTTPGGQNFSSADAVSTGTTQANISGLTSGETYYVVVRAMDPSSNTDQNTHEIMVSLPRLPLRITTTSLPDAQPGQQYQATLAADGGLPPYQWMLTGGALPPGLTIASTGSISDTALDDGVYSMIIQVRDAAGDSSSATFMVTATPPPALSVAADMTIAGGVQWYSTVTVENGATLTISDDIVIHAVDSVVIDGSIQTDCHSIEIRTTESFSVDGDITNTCSTMPGDPPGIKIVADGELLLGSAVGSDPVVVSDGDIMLTDSYTEDADLTPIFVEELTGSAGNLNLLSRKPQPPKGGGAKINRPPQAGSGRTNSTARDGNVDVNANMNGNDGQDAGGATVVGGNGGTLSLAARNGTLTIAAGTTLSAGNGGDGAAITATGCPAMADASASKGGRGGSILVGGSSVVFGAGVILNRGNGGNGGAATATGDPAGGPCQDGCAAVATSGPGGTAGGIGYVLTHPGNGIIGAPTEGGGNGGKGGLATATASNGLACNVCPGGDGGSGKEATATGGKGGDGAKGKIWPIVAGTHKAGDGGDAIATGGSGGDGADCCTPPMQGGNGGNGEDGTATAGAPGDKGITPGVPGTYTAQGGSAGKGGDGKPNGRKGTFGSGIGTGTAGTATDGADSQDGVFCFNIYFWYIYFSTLPDGPIPPGNPMHLKACSSQDVLTQEAEIEVAFLTQQENGGVEVQYQKQNDDVIIFSGGMKIIPAGTNHPQFPGATWWSGGMTLDFLTMQPGLTGTVTIMGFDQNQILVGQTDLQITPTSPPVLSIALQAPQGTVYSELVVHTSVPLRFNHWWMRGWFIDP